MDKSPTLTEKLLNKKPEKKPEISSNPAIILGEIYDALVKNREEELRHREQLKNFKQENQEEEETKRKKILESFKPDQRKKQQKEQKKQETRSTKSILEKIGYPGGIAGVLTDITIITGIILATNKKTEETEKELDTVEKIPLDEEIEKIPEEVPEIPKVATPEKPTKEPKETSTAAPTPSEPTAKEITPTAPPVTPKQPEAPSNVLVDSSGQPVLDSSGKPITTGEAKELIKEKPKAEPGKPVPEKPVMVEPVKPEIGGNKALVIKELDSAGFSKTAKANVLANVEKESAFKPRSEELAKYSAKTLFKLYGPPGVEGGQPKDGKNTVRFQTLQDAEQLVVKGPEAVGDVIYGGRMGNTQKGDGYKYRGRGFIQITGKDNYARIGKALGIDLVNNPDLANKPEIAAKIVPLFFTLGRKKPSDLEDIDVVNKLVGSASEKSKEERKILAAKYIQEQPPSTGTQLASLSTQNRDMKDEMKKDRPVNTVNVAMQTQTSNKAVQPQETFDDRPIYLRKSLA